MHALLVSTTLVRTPKVQFFVCPVLVSWCWMMNRLVF